MKYSYPNKYVRNQRFNNKILIQQNHKPAEYNATGVWHANYGRAVILQKNNKITGYAGIGGAVFNGIISGKVMDGDWIYLEPTELYSGHGYGTLRFFGKSFVGEWTNLEDNTSGTFFANKIADLGEGNCYRYRIVHDVTQIPILFINELRLNYQEISPYFYPISCTDKEEISIRISDNDKIIRYVSFQPGFSYTITLMGEGLDVIVEVDNPFPND